MKPADRFEQSIRELRVATDPARDREILELLLCAQRERRAQQRAPGTGALRRGPRPVLAAVVSLAIVLLFAVIVMDRSASRAWAIEDAIVALRAHHAVHIVAAVPGGIIEMWMRTNPVAAHSTDVLVQAPGGVVTWTSKGQTYHHDPASNTVFTEPAITVGFVPWLGRDLLEALARADGAKLLHGRELVFGREIVTLIGSITDVTGPQSWIIRFDATTKLPVSFKTWRNLDRRGPPAFDARKMTFYDDLPAALFERRLPAGAQVVERPLAIPAEMLGLLANPDDGVPVDGRDRQSAAEHILRELGQALIDRDAGRFRKLVPLARSWGDNFLKATVLSPANAHARVVKVLDIAPISRTGRTTVGPIVCVPLVTLRADGTKVRDRIIVQFRDFGGQQSCVVFGPHGLPEQIE